MTVRLVRLLLLTAAVGGCAAGSPGEGRPTADGQLPLTSVRRLSVDGTRLELAIDLGCPTHLLDGLEVHETEYEVQIGAIDGGDAGVDEDCSQEIARSPATATIELAEPVAEREVVEAPSRRLVPWEFPRDTLGVFVTVSGQRDVVPASFDQDLGLTFDHEGTCVLVWPGQFDGGSQSFLARVAARPGGTVRIGIAPMHNPLPTVVEACPPEHDRAPATELVLPPPSISSDPIDGLRLDVDAGFIIASQRGWVVDPKRLRVTWIGT
jgi:hypothetical protein